MDRADLSARSIVIGHLTISIPTVAILLLTLRFGYYVFGPDFWPYYITGGLALGWQWYSAALPRWKTWAIRNEAGAYDPEEIARQSGLIWPGASGIGLFGLHTTAAAICGIHIGPWLVGRWFAWILPLLGARPTEFAADYWLQHLELASIVPSLIVGYLSYLFLRRMAVWAWIVPTAALACRLLTFTDPHASVLVADPWSRFSYYFVIEKVMPTIYNLRGSDPARVTAQITLVAPFYSGVAYSIGAFTLKTKVLRRMVDFLTSEPEPEVIEPEEADAIVIADERIEDPAGEK